MESTHTASRVLIDAPDGAAALALEQRLVHLSPTAIARGNQWFVEIEAVEDLPSLEAAIRGWLRELGAAEAHLRVDDRDVRVSSSVFDAHRHDPLHHTFDDDFDL